MGDAPNLGHLIGYCARLAMLHNDKALRRAGYDVTPVQSHVLIYLSCQRTGQSVNQRDLERELRLKPSTVNGIVRRLEEKGYIVRKTSPADGRCRLVSLTKAGQKKVDAFRTVMDSTGRRFSSGLSGAEEETLRELLSRVIENLENEVNRT